MRTYTIACSTSGCTNLRQVWYAVLDSRRHTATVRELHIGKELARRACRKTYPDGCVRVGTVRNDVFVAL